MEELKLEHKKQLHERVQERSAQLKATLLTLQADNATSDRARAIEDALAALETHTSGGWDAVDESESAAIGRWLDSSRFLFDAKPPVAAAVQS